MKAGLFTLMLILSSATLAATQERPDEELRTLLSEAINSAESFEDRFDAEVWLKDMTQRLSRWKDIPHEERITMLKVVHQEATHFELPPELILALIQTESNFERYAISSAGARGLMQVMPFWKDEIGRPDDNLFEIRTNIRYGCAILKHYLEREKGNYQKALARYNGSVGKRWYPDRVYTALNSRWFKN